MSQKEAIHALEVLNQILQDNKHGTNHELTKLVEFNMVSVLRLCLFNDK